MNMENLKDEKKTKDTYGLLKITLMVTGFVIFIILVKYLLDFLQK